MESDRGENILIADDDSTCLESLRLCLSAAQYCPQVADDGVTALELFHVWQPRVVIANWQMSGLDGLELCRKIRELEQANPTYFILLTALADRTRLLAAFANGTDDYLVKPVEAGELLSHVEAGLRITRMCEALRQVRATAAII